MTSKVLKVIYTVIVWHSVRVICDTAYWYVCARGFLWSFVTHGSDVCRILRGAQ